MYISISVAIWIPKSRVDFTRSDAEEWGNHPVLDQNQLLGCPYRNYQMLILWDVNYMADMGGFLKWGYPATLGIGIICLHCAILRTFPQTSQALRGKKLATVLVVEEV